MKNESHISKEDVLDWLQAVKDPEIPVISLVDLGVITNIEIKGDHVKVDMTPTFVGCPAMDAMRDGVLDVLRKHGVKAPEVDINFKQAWNSDRITERGRKALKEFGLAPPPVHNMVIDLDILDNVPCPHCDSVNTIMKSPFGPTQCRSIHHCEDCKETFEQFKPVN